MYWGRRAKTGTVHTVTRRNRNSFLFDRRSDSFLRTPLPTELKSQLYAHYPNAKIGSVVEDAAARTLGLATWRPTIGLMSPILYSIYSVQNRTHESDC